MKKYSILLALGATALLAVSGCAIENDIPYPTVEGYFSAIEVEGQCDASGNASTSATISKSAYTAQLYVDDTVDLSAVTITKMTTANDAAIIPDSAACADYSNFPQTSFSSLSELESTANTTMDFTNPVAFTLRTYQDYEWTVSVERVLLQEILLANQVGDAEIDNDAQTATIYVSSSQNLSTIAVTTFDLGGQNGTVEPDPTASSTFDFSSPVTFDVTFAWETTSREYTVTVEQVDDGDIDYAATAYPWTTRAYLDGRITAGLTPEIEYKASTATTWTTLSSDNVTVSGTTYSACITGLEAETTYNYRTNVEGEEGETLSFTTYAATPLTDGDFDNWYQDDDVWNPWAEGGESFWDTGNRGAASISSSNSVPTDDTCTGEGQAALLESKYIVIRFAAGNIFTGEYKETTGTNAVLDFGRPFTGFPSALRVNYKFTTSTIDKVGDDDYEWLRGVPDSCHIYIALTDWDEPYEIRTRPSERQLFDPSDEHVIAYANFISGDDIPDWTQNDLELVYRYTDRVPTYILVVASASKYGDFFTGGSSSTMYVDNFELIYE